MLHRHTGTALVVLAAMLGGAAGGGAMAQPAGEIAEKRSDLDDLKKRIRDLKGKPDTKDEIQVLEKYLQLKEDIADGKRVQKALKYDLLTKLADKYSTLTEDETRCLVVEKKWLATLAERLDSEMQQISQNLTTRVSELAERYAQTLPAIDAEIVELEEKVKSHLQKMGFVWN